MHRENKYHLASRQWELEDVTESENDLGSGGGEMQHKEQIR